MIPAQSTSMSMRASAIWSRPCPSPVGDRGRRCPGASRARVSYPWQRLSVATDAHKRVASGPSHCLDPSRADRLRGDQFQRAGAGRRGSNSYAAVTGVHRLDATQSVQEDCAGRFPVLADKYGSPLMECEPLEETPENATISSASFLAP
jgi:hypothetical protein